ncbi:hypothetical protein GPALN_014155 [Globodera pallida]|nr:hypothetical protein GPALN_014155 [Globodera pallida]
MFGNNCVGCTYNYSTANACSPRVHCSCYYCCDPQYAESCPDGCRECVKDGEGGCPQNSAAQFKSIGFCTDQEVGDADTLSDRNEIEEKMNMELELKDVKQLQEEMKELKVELKEVKEELKGIKKELKDMKELEGELKEVKQELKNTKEENKELRTELAHQKQLNACMCMTLGEMLLNMEKLKQQQNQNEKIGNIPDFVLGCKARTDELEGKQKADQEEHRAKIDEKTMEAKVALEHQKLVENHKALHIKMEEFQNKQQQNQEDHEKLKNIMEEMNLKQQQHQKKTNDKIGWLNEDQQKLVSIDQFSRVQTAVSDLEQKQNDDQKELLWLKSVQSMVVSELRQQNMELQSDQKALSATIGQLFNERDEKLNNILGQFVEEQNKKLEQQQETDGRMLQKKMDELGNNSKKEFEKEMNQLKGDLIAKMEEYQKQQQLNIHAKMEQYQNKQQQTIVDLQQTVAVLNDKINGKDAHASNNLTTNQFVRIQNAHASNNSTTNQFVGIKHAPNQFVSPAARRPRLIVLGTPRLGAPNRAAPIRAALNRAAPYRAAPNRATHNRAAPIRAAPYRAAPNRATHNRAAPIRAAPYRAAPNRATHNRAAPIRAAPYRATHNRAAPIRAAPYRAAPNRAAHNRAAPILLSRDDLLDSSKLVDQLRLVEEAHLKAARKFGQVREMIQKYRQDGLFLRDDKGDVDDTLIKHMNRQADHFVRADNVNANDQLIKNIQGIIAKIGNNACICNSTATFIQEARNGASKPAWSQEHGLRPALRKNERIPCDYCELIHKKALKVSENFSELFLGFAILCARIKDVKEREYCIGHVNFLKQQFSSFLRFQLNENAKHNCVKYFVCKE